jgi:hypothetical protein
MMFKLVALACVATAYASPEENLNAAFAAEVDVKETTRNVNNLGARLSAVERAVGVVASGLATAEKSMQRTTALAGSVAGLQEDVAAVNDTLVTQLVDRKAYLVDKLASTRAALDEKLQASLAAITAKMSAQNQAIDDEVKGRVDAVANDVSTVVEAAEPVATFTAEMDDCIDDGEVYNPDKDKCVEAAIGTSAHMGSVYHSTWDQNDDRDSGYVDNRFLKFKKEEDDTYIRVFYFDALRTHGHHPHGRWNVMFCNANGDNCAHCADPGRVQNWRYGYHQYGLWSWDAMASRTFGLCKKSDNTDMKAGEYSVKIYIESNHYDLATGYAMPGNFMVDEVIKY